jgi:probable HAF family extracellular repeat protein
MSASFRPSLFHAGLALAIVAFTGCDTASIPTSNGEIRASGAGTRNVVRVERVIALEPLPGAYRSEANDVNDLGQVVGASYTADGKFRPVMWDNSPYPQALEVGEFDSAVAEAVNSTGTVVVGYEWTYGGANFPVRWIKVDGAWKMEQLGDFPHDTFVCYGDETPTGEGKAMDVADDGTVTGWAFGCDDAVHGFVWHPSNAPAPIRPPLEPIPGMYEAEAINSHGEIAGRTSDPLAAIWSPSLGLTTLGTLGGDASYGFDVNDRGEVVGSSSTGTVLHAFLWNRKAAMVDLSAGTDVESEARGMNKDADAVGYVNAGSGERATLWTKKESLQLIPLAGYESANSIANAINNRGQIAGVSFVVGGVSRATVWTVK